MRMAVHDRDPALARAALHHREAGPVEAAWRIQAQAGQTADPLRRHGPVGGAPGEPRDQLMVHRPVRHPGHPVPGFGERAAEAGEVDPIPAHRPALGQAEGEALGTVEGLIVRGNERRHGGPDALFQRFATAPDRLVQPGPPDAGEPFVLQGMAGDFVARRMNGAQ